MKFSCAFALIFSFFFFSACQSYKKVPYLQDAEVLKQVNTQVSPVQDARLIPGDEVSILVSTSDPVVSQPFNAQGSTFLLDDQGNINYPVSVSYTHLTLPTTEILRERKTYGSSPYVRF